MDNLLTYREGTHEVNFPGLAFPGDRITTVNNGHLQRVYLYRPFMALILIDILILIQITKGKA